MRDRNIMSSDIIPPNGIREKVRDWYVCKIDDSGISYARNAGGTWKNLLESAG